MAKHVRLEISDTSFHFERDQVRIAAEAALDGLCVIRSSVPAERMSSQELVRSYKRLARVERDFRMLKTTGLQLRPVYHRLEDRVRAHVFLCFLAAYLRWHLERAWAPLLFRDGHRVSTEDPVAPAQRSPAALAKAHTQRLADGTEVHKFSTLLEQLATLTKNRLRLKGSDATFERLAMPTPLQSQALRLLGLTPTL